jgi:hypothetical protein
MSQNLSESTVRDFEKARRLPTINIRRALESAGVEFIAENGGGLDVEGKFVRIEIQEAPEPGTSTPSNSTGLGRAGLPQHQSEHDWGTVLVYVAVWAVLGIPLWILVAQWLGFIS